MILAQFFKYALVGVSNALIHFSILNALSVAFDVYAGAPIILVNSAAAAAATANSYVWNKRWTFRSRGVVGVEFPRFAAVNLGALAIDTAIIYALTTYIPPPAGLTPLLWENAAKVVSLGVVVAWNFLGFRRFVFRQARPSDSSAAAHQ